MTEHHTDQCTRCGQAGHNASQCKKPCCGNCEHIDAKSVLQGFALCTKNTGFIRMAKRYAAHSPCDKGRFQPRQQPKPTKETSHDQPSLI